MSNILAIVMGACLTQTGGAQRTDPPPLSGPRVVEAAARASIVERDFNGKVRRPETSAEEAALAVVSIPKEKRADVKERVDRILRERDGILDKFVSGNIDLLTKFGQAQATENKLDQLALLTEAMRKLSPLRERGTLQQEIEGALPEESREEFKRLMKEYHDALVAEVRADEKKAAMAGEEGQGEGMKADRKADKNAKKPDPKPRFAIMIDENLKGLGRDIERSFARQLKNGELVFRYLTAGLKLSPEQEAKIRTTCMDFAERTKGEDLKGEQVKLFFAIWGQLDKEQQKVFGKRVNGKK